MSTLTVMLVRHGEKPGASYPGPGFTPNGVADDKSLVLRGWQRAGAWAALFAAGPVDDYPRANVVYAARPAPVSKKASFSHRPFETAGPSAGRLNLDIRSEFGVGQEEDLVGEIKQLTGVVLVFWEHKSICGGIVPALLGSQSIPGVPTKWDGDRFDVVLRFDRSLPDAPWSFRQLSPRLLKGDSDQPFAERIT